MKIKLRDYRLKKDMSMDDLMIVSGVNKSTISNIERKENYNPRIRTLCLLAKALGITLYELVDCECEDD